MTRPKTRILDGDWDRLLKVQVYWCSVYEPALDSERGMVPLDKYVFYCALQQHFVERAPWKVTEWYQWITERQQIAPVRRYETHSAIQERLDLLDQLYQELKNGGYRDDPIDRPIVNIGRHGRIAIEDGRHRLCVARIAGVSNMLVDVNVIHAEVGPLASQLNSHYAKLV